MATPQLFKTTGIIIKRNNIGEGDKILTVFCKYIGKKRFIAKGIRKVTSRRASHLELFTKTDFVIHRGKTLDSITAATAINIYSASYHTLSQVASAYFASEIIERLIMENQEHDGSFDLLDTLLSDIGTCDSAGLAGRLTTFVDDILIELGFRTKETKSASLEHAISAIEDVMERKLRSKNILSRSGVLT